MTDGSYTGLLQKILDRFSLQISPSVIYFPSFTARQKQTAIQAYFKQIFGQFSLYKSFMPGGQLKVGRSIKKKAVVSVAVNNGRRGSRQAVWRLLGLPNHAAAIQTYFRKILDRFSLQ